MRYLCHDVSAKVTHYLRMAIEYYARPIIFFTTPLWVKNSHVFGLDLEKLVFVVSKW